MSQFSFGDRVKVGYFKTEAVYLCVISDEKSCVWYKGASNFTIVFTRDLHHATEAPVAPPTIPAPSDEIDTKIIAIINQLRQSMRHWLGAMLDISVPQHGLSETNRIYHTANELEQRLVDYRDLLTANIASRQEGAACGS